MMEVADFVGKVYKLEKVENTGEFATYMSKKVFAITSWCINNLSFVRLQQFEAKKIRV